MCMLEVSTYEPIWECTVGAWHALCTQFLQDRIIFPHSDSTIPCQAPRDPCALVNLKPLITMVTGLDLKFTETYTHNIR